MTVLTFICQEGMKSALCRTLSKIFCSWGLMNELSRTNYKKGKVYRKPCQEILPLRGHLDTILHWCCYGVYPECWASVLSWVQHHALCRECWLFSQHWPLTGEASPSGLSCLQNRITVLLWQVILGTTHNKDCSNEINTSHISHLQAAVCHS